MDSMIKDMSSSSMVVTSTIRLRAGGLVAKEKASGIPYRSLNVRRGNAMRYLVLDYIKQRQYGDKHILLPTLSEEKRKAMENIAANEFFKYADAYTPEEHFFPLHIKPSGELYYIPEKKVKQMLYVVNKLKKCSLESIVSDVTWESSSIEGDDDDEDQFILDFKTDKVLAKANHCELLAHEIEQYYYGKSSDGPPQCEEPPDTTDCYNLRRSLSLPIINVPKVKYRLKKPPAVSKALSDDNLNMILADINQHRLAYTRSIKEVDKREKHVEVDAEIDQQTLEKHVRFASNELKKSLQVDFIEDVKPSTSKISFDETNRPAFFDLLDQDIDTYDEINDTIYREINEVKGSIYGAKDEMGQKFQLTHDDFDNYDKQSNANIQEKDTFGDFSQPSTSSGVYQKEIKPIRISEDKEFMKDEGKKFNKGERYLMEKLLKDERALNKTKQIIKMKRRVKLNDDTVEQFTDEEILDQIKNKPKRFNLYTLQKLQTEFDTSTIGDSRNPLTCENKNPGSTDRNSSMTPDTRKLMATPCCTSVNQPELLSTTHGSEIEMKTFTKSDSDSITDCEMSDDVDESVYRKHLKKFKRKTAGKRAKSTSSKLSLSNIPIIGRFFQNKS